MSSLFVLRSWFHDTLISMFIVFAWMFSYRADGKTLLAQQETVPHSNYTCCLPFHFPSAFDEIVFSETLWILSQTLTSAIQPSSFLPSLFSISISILWDIFLIFTCNAVLRYFIFGFFHYTECHIPLGFQRFCERSRHTIPTDLNNPHWL